MRLFFVLGFILLNIFSPHKTFGQSKALQYYLPKEKYNPSIPTPQSILGFEVGEWHISHDKINEYFKAINEASDRTHLTYYAKSHEQRDLIYLTFTSRKNQSSIDFIKKEHKQLCTRSSNDVDISTLPAIIYQGYSVHGNESSGSNAAVLIAYYLAASQSEYTKSLLDNMVIMIDPCMNPDGLNRFASWVNSHRSEHLNPDENSREFTEAWPRGRTNHYWFDLNRDWMFLIHPESKGRIQTFQDWKPDVLTDHHEMGKHATFFFQPGVPSRTNPLTLKENQKITELFGTYHAKNLDSIGSSYFSKERFDDYYYGKGSTYPDINGCIGILFEQASARGHLQETKNGLIGFPFTIRNQVVTSFSTQKAAYENRIQLLEQKRQFYAEKRRRASQKLYKGYTFKSNHSYRLHYFLDVLKSHAIDVYRMPSDEMFYVPIDQPQSGLIETFFEPIHTFNDSIFYDVSAWDFTYALDLTLNRVKNEPKNISLVSDTKSKPTILTPNQKENALIIDWKSDLAPAFLQLILTDSITHKVIIKQKEINDKIVYPGDLIISLNLNDSTHLMRLNKHLQQFPVKHSIMHLKKDFFGSKKVHRFTKTLSKQKIGMLVGDGISSYDAGYIWHQMDVRWSAMVSHLDVRNVHKMDLSKYQTLIIPNCTGSLSEPIKNKIEKWTKEGGNLILIKSSIKLAIDNAWISNLMRKENAVLKTNDDESITPMRRSAQLIGGAILQSNIKKQSALTYGYTNTSIPLFHQGNAFYSLPNQTIIEYAKDPILSGYCSDENKVLIPESTALSYSTFGDGNITYFSDNPCFRGYWFASQKLLANAIYFSTLIDSADL